NDSFVRSFDEAVRQGNYRVAGLPRFEPVPSGEGEADVRYQAVFEVYPEVALGDLASVAVTRPVTPVTDAEVDRTLETLRKQRAKFERVERAARTGDLVNIDFTGRIDGTPFDGGAGQAFTVVLGEGRMLPDFEKALEGLAAGAEKVFPLTFPEDYAEQLKGKTAEFTVKCNEVAEPKLPELDAEFARALGIEDGDVSRMRAEVRQNVEREVKKRIAARVKDQVMEGLVSVARFDVPQSLVEQQVARMREEAVGELKSRGMTTENLQLPAELFTERADRRVRLGLAVSDVVRVHGLQAKPEQVRKVIEEHAESFERPAEMVRWFYGQRDRLAEVEALVVEDNVVEWALGRMAVKDEPMAFEDLMGTKKP
ncbi:MAG TPA: trigger factor, partial [Usitatibacteraceae bacterium]|nr:trigger factor [Usitatibacteraceae bacterium]